MARRSANLGLGVLIAGLLVAGALGALLVDFDGDDGEETVTPTTAAPGEATTTAPGATTTVPAGATTTAPGGTAGTGPGATTTVPSGLAGEGTGTAGDTDGVTPATGAETGWLLGAGALSLLLATRLHRYTRERSGAFERP